ncbi:MAG: UMP kinase [Candidatus Hydrogenedentota bacterium]
MSQFAYKRILLKLSGEALDPGKSCGIDFEALSRFASEIGEVHAQGVEIGLVVGGGNIFRGAQVPAELVDRITGDSMGMLATVINALALQATLESKGVPTRVLTAIEMRPFAEPFIRRRAIRHLEKGRVVILGGGTGNPLLTTDTAAALRAVELKADAVFKATKVDGVYDSDPVLNGDAHRYETLNYRAVLNQNLKVMDAAAISLCQENNMPILVFNLTRPGSIMKALRGESIGTTVRGE